MEIIKKIKPWILLHDNTKVTLNFVEQEGNIYGFTDDEGKVTLSLEQKEKYGVTAIYVNAVIKPVEYPYDNINYFNMECAVGLDIEDLGNMKGYMANHLPWEYWCRPFLGSDLKEVPSFTQALLWEKNDGNFGFMLPVCDEKYKCTINGSENGLTLKVMSWYFRLNECKTLAFMIGENSNPFRLTEKCTMYGLELLGNGYKIRKERRYPEIFEYIGWCSWDAFQTNVNEAGLLEKCEEFKQKQIPIRWVIIDDMWADVKDLNKVPQTMHKCKLYSFEADKVRFPNGLKGCIDKIKEKYVLKVGIWYPTTGYWKGIDPEGEIAKKYGDLLITVNDDRVVHSPLLDKAFMFYNAFNSFLKKCGTDFVKIDNQSFIRGFLKGILSIGELARNIHKAIESSVGSNFDNQLINCMGMAMENMWNRPISAISRCSGDFQPENREWFIQHILQCSYNSVVQGNFLWSDWDMWWTDDGQAIKNSVLRAISGGPVYVSDKVNRSIKEVLLPIVFSDGRILRCDRPAVPTKDCLVLDPQNSELPFKVWNTCGVSGVVAAFNLNKNNKAVKGSISAGDVDGIEGHEFSVFEYFSRTAEIIQKNDKVNFLLESQDDFKLFIISPLRNGFAAIGLIDKYMSPKAIVLENDKFVELFEGGLFAFVSNNLVKKVLVNGEEVVFVKNGQLYSVDCSNVDGRVRVEICL